jgi:hypothetical protein
MRTDSLALELQFSAWQFSPNVRQIVDGLLFNWQHLAVVGCKLNYHIILLANVL